MEHLSRDLQVMVGDGSLTMAEASAMGGVCPTSPGQVAAKKGSAEQREAAEEARVLEAAAVAATDATQRAVDQTNRKIVRMNSGGDPAVEAKLVKVDASCTRMRESNPATMAESATNLLTTVIKNIIKNPANAKFRKIRKTNPKIAAKMLSARGALGVLCAVGFRIEGDFLLMDDDMVDVRVLEHAMLRLRQVLTNLDSDADSARNDRLAASRAEAKKAKARRDQLKASISGDNAARSDPNWKATAFEKTGKKIQRFEDIGVDVNGGGG